MTKKQYQHLNNDMQNMAQQARITTCWMNIQEEGERDSPQILHRKEQTNN